MDGLLIAAHHLVDVFRPAGAALNLEDTHAGPHQAVDEAHGLQVLRAHDVFVVYLQLMARLVVGGGVAAAAHLDALAAVSAAVGLVQAHVALAADGHAEGAVAEHFYSDLLTAGAADVLLLDVAVNLGHLLHLQFAGQHHHVGKLRIESQRFNVGNVQLRAEVNLHAHLSTVLHYGHIAGDDGADAGLAGSVYNLVHQVDVLVVDDGVHGEVALHAVLLTGGGYLLQVVDGEGRG